jgi:hypothetical protein
MRAFWKTAVDSLVLSIRDTSLYTDETKKNTTSRTDNTALSYLCYFDVEIVDVAKTGVPELTPQTFTPACSCLGFEPLLLRCH